ncbi:MAG: bifunctional metallophosphatase/5'-nucleotidase [Armatimonadetes bacterium]|nr:bifunctional metallophosphatase/5'-nucleotidase [Armatimonadota bacterium]
MLRAVDIFHFNDFHRHLGTFGDGSGGAARLASLADRERAEHPGSVIVNVGDNAGDNAVPSPNAFDPLADIFDAMGIELVALGNHELEDPTGNYASLRTGFIEPFDGQVLCANATVTETGSPLPGTKPYTIMEINGVDVAFIGVVTRDLELAMFPSAGAGLTLASPEETLKELVPKVRREGADAVVVLAHEGLKEAESLASRVRGIDAILAGHDHRTTPEPVMVPSPGGGTTAVAEAGGYGQQLGHLRLQVDTARRRVVSVEGRMIPVSADLPADPEIQRIVDAYPGTQHVEKPAARHRWERVGSFAELAARLQGDRAANQSPAGGSKHEETTS